ncbi:hypothetical protein NPIL_631231, partial [Nephila pilipes]
MENSTISNGFEQLGCVKQADHMYNNRQPLRRSCKSETAVVVA